MKVLIRDKAKQLYLAGDGRWVESIADGRDFVHCADAMAHLLEKKLNGVEVYCSFPNSQYNFPVPLEAFEMDMQREKTSQPAS